MTDDSDDDGAAARAAPGTFPPRPSGGPDELFHHHGAVHTATATVPRPRPPPIHTDAPARPPPADAAARPPPPANSLRTPPPAQADDDEVSARTAARAVQLSSLRSKRLDLEREADSLVASALELSASSPAGQSPGTIEARRARIDAQLRAAQVAAARSPTFEETARDRSAAELFAGGSVSKYASGRGAAAYARLPTTDAPSPARPKLQPLSARRADREDDGPPAADDDHHHADDGAIGFSRFEDDGVRHGHRHEAQYGCGWETAGYEFLEGSVCCVCVVGVAFFSLALEGWDITHDISEETHMFHSKIQMACSSFFISELLLHIYLHLCIHVDFFQCGFAKDCFNVIDITTCTLDALSWIFFFYIEAQMHAAHHAVEAAGGTGHGGAEALAPSPAPSPGVACTDADIGCLDWAANGQCESNPSFMTVMCAVSCNLCEISLRGVAATPGPTPVCVDADEACAGWAEAGECEANQDYMASACALSCGFCVAVAANGLQKAGLGRGKRLLRGLRKLAAVACDAACVEAKKQQSQAGMARSASKVARVAKLAKVLKALTIAKAAKGAIHFSVAKQKMKDAKRAETTAASSTQSHVTWLHSDAPMPYVPERALEAAFSHAGGDKGHLTPHEFAAFWGNVCGGTAPVRADDLALMLGAVAAEEGLVTMDQAVELFVRINLAEEPFDGAHFQVRCAPRAG